MNRRLSLSPQRGVTLIELMVGILIGLFLVSVMGMIFLGSKGTFVAQNQVARLQESARFTADVVAGDLRMAGFRGCQGSGVVTGLTNTLNTPTGYLYNFGQGVWASRNAGGSWTPALDSVVTSLSPAPSAGDVLTLRHPVGAGWALTSEMASANAALGITPTAGITARNLLMVSDCAGAAVFQATNANPGVDGSIEHSASVTGLTPGVSTTSLGRPYLQDALVHRMATTTYYLANSQRPGRTNVRALWSHTSPVYDGSVQPQELVTGVDGLQVTLGLDTNNNGGADVFVSPSQVTNWSQVVSTQVEILIVSLDDGVTSTPQPYTFGGTTVTPTDRRMRSVMTLSASVRNAMH